MPDNINRTNIQTLSIMANTQRKQQRSLLQIKNCLQLLIQDKFHPDLIFKIINEWATNLPKYLASLPNYGTIPFPTTLTLIQQTGAYNQVSLIIQNECSTTVLKFRKSGEIFTFAPPAPRYFMLYLYLCLTVQCTQEERVKRNKIEMRHERRSVVENILS